MDFLWRIQKPFIFIPVLYESFNALEGSGKFKIHNLKESNHWLSLKNNIKTIFNSIINKAYDLDSAKIPIHVKRANASLNTPSRYHALCFQGGKGKKNFSKLAFYELSVNNGSREEINQFGEDAGFIVNSSHIVVLGVSDGVGGYNNQGIDPSKFSFELMSKMKEITQDSFKKTEIVENPTTLISLSYEYLLAKNPPIYGGATVNVATINLVDMVAKVSNLGDSKFMIFRPSTNELFSTKEQQHYFNCPYQLSNVPGEYNRKRQSDGPLNAATYEFSLKAGDIVLQGSDGFFDNMFDEDIINVIKKYTDSPDSQMKCFKELLENSYRYSIDEYRECPFTIGYNLAHGTDFVGGKVDDITLNMAFIKSIN